MYKLNAIITAAIVITVVLVARWRAKKKLKSTRLSACDILKFKK